MVSKGDDPPKRKRRSRRAPEVIWIRAFLGISGTENITRFCRDDLNGVSLTRAIEAIQRGECVSTDKCDGPGAICTFVHESDDDEVEVQVFFEAGTVMLEIRGARRVKEVESEPDAA
jgi:hypothetical protein